MIGFMRHALYFKFVDGLLRPMFFHLSVPIKREDNAPQAGPGLAGRRVERVTNTRTVTSS